MTALVINGDTSGSITLQAPSAAGAGTVHTLPAVSGTVMVSGNIPVFSVTNNGTGQTLSNATWTKVALNTKDFDTANAFDTTNYRYLPNVAGYYNVSGFVSGPSNNTQNQILAVYKNGSVLKWIGAVSNLNATSVTNNGPAGSMVLYLNGSTDYIEFWIFQQTGGSALTAGYAWATGFLVRTA
jgi:hypothetical protein